MSRALSSDRAIALRARVEFDPTVVDNVMAIHRATFAKLVANDLDEMFVRFFEDAAATYWSFAQTLRENSDL